MSKSIKDLPANQMYCKSSEIYFAQRHFPEKWENYPLEQIDEDDNRTPVEEFAINCDWDLIDTDYNTTPSIGGLDSDDSVSTINPDILCLPTCDDISERQNGWI